MPAIQLVILLAILPACMMPVIAHAYTALVIQHVTAHVCVIVLAIRLAIVHV